MSADIKAYLAPFYRAGRSYMMKYYSVVRPFHDQPCETSTSTGLARGRIVCGAANRARRWGAK